jgi:hypothetical protein
MNRFVFIAFSLFTLTGCGASTGAVTGTVTYQNKTVASGTVVVFGSDSLPYYGIIQEDGSYTVPKVPAGPAKIAVVSPGPDAGQHMPPFVMAGPGKVKSATPPPFRGDPKKWFPLPARYRDFDDSGLTVTVTSGVNKRDIALKE